MLKLEKEHKAGIITGIIGTILFVYFLQPILDWVSGAVVALLTLTSTAYLDRIYAQAAHLRTQDFAFLWLMLVFSVFAGGVFAAGLRRVIGPDRLRSLLRPIADRPRAEPGRAYQVMSGALLVFVGLFFVAVASANYIQLRVISSFEQHMRALGPYISEAEEEQLYSRWSLMQSHQDYEALYATLHSLADKHNVNLPENKLYSPNAL